MSMDFVEVERAKSLAYFKQVEKIYLASFPVSQIRPIKMITRMLEFDSNYHLFVVKQHDFLVGFSLLYAFNELNIAFLDFMAIDKRYRGRSVGSDLFKYTLNASRHLVKNSSGVIFEIQRESPRSMIRKNSDREGLCFTEDMVQKHLKIYTICYQTYMEVSPRTCT